MYLPFLTLLLSCDILWGYQATGPFQIENMDFGKCLTNDLTLEKCEKNKQKQLWKWNEKKLENLESGKCMCSIDSAYSAVTTGSCSVKPKQIRQRYEWGCLRTSVGTPSIKKGKALKGKEICLDFKANSTLSFAECSKAFGQVWRIHGTISEMICSRKYDMGQQTTDPNYYHFKNKDFELTWGTKYVRVFLVYSHSMFQRFVTTFGGVENARKAIKLQALDGISVLDKAYREIKVRMILGGYEVWENKDMINNTGYYHQIKASFRVYSATVMKKKYDYDTAIFIYGNRWIGSGAAGAGMGDFCKPYRSMKDEIFVMASKRTTANFLANLLGHEIGHQFYQGHRYEPSTPCPNYRIWQSVCVMGGNNDPKGFDKNFLNAIRSKGLSCLDPKPKQSNIPFCGNGVIDIGEECDCGSSAVCDCCDGQICKLKAKAECSSEKCCSQCKYDESKTGCKGNIITLKDVEGYIQSTGENSQHYNVHRHWRIQASAGKVISLFFLGMSRRDLKEGCPYDYIGVRDGGDLDSKSLVKVCGYTSLTPFVTSSANEMLVTFHADQTVKNTFKLFYQVHDPVQNKGVFYIKHKENGKCMEYNQASRYFQFQDAPCKDKFTMGDNHRIYHVSTGSCLRIRMRGGNLHLTANCQNRNTVFFMTSQGFLIKSSGEKCVSSKRKSGAAIRSGSCRGLIFEKA